MDLFAETDTALDVAHAAFIEGLRLSWQELFEGFDTLRAITYSSDTDFMTKLVGRFEKAEIIFGFSEILSYTLQEIIAYQDKAVERIKESAAKNKIDLVSRIDAGTLRLLVAREHKSHEKLYLLRNKDGGTRVIIGSANMSTAAFTGRQREKLCYMEESAAFDWYAASFERLRDDSSDEISVTALRLDESGDSLSVLPIADTLRVKKALIIEPAQENREEARFALDVRNLATKLSPFMPKPDAAGKTTLLPEHIRQTVRRIENAKIQEKELGSVFPELTLDCEAKTAALNGKTLDLRPDKERVGADAALFLKYMQGYEKFHGDAASLQKRYYDFAVWFFATPFMARLRYEAILNNQNLLPYPVFGLVYGQSKAGKTSFLETLVKMMVGEKTKMNAVDFTRSNIEQLKRTVKGVPIVVDDLTQNRFSAHAVETIKNDEFGRLDGLLQYPAVVISANEDVKAVAPEIVRRTIICRVQAGLKNTELIKSNLVKRVQTRIGTAFYREYLRRMFDRIDAVIGAIRSDDDADVGRDILALSSAVLAELFAEYASSPLSAFVRLRTTDDFFDEKITGSHAIKTIRDAWKTNPKAFVINKKLNELRYSAGENHWDAVNLKKELPEDLEATRSRECIIMKLDKASEFFGIVFKRRLFG
ncbi:phospholipase D family protein [Treponema endosymbiont of Eucomonympha sp.]|uniref:phospholipase D family protein n=2 Tax=Treponema endosymbiont of Eucomonympha sp. TaxID=1580831 RepID=UPI000780CCDC|nr:phospholipase D family protein [Treponema endosymbiont of Eucomonympha sp.]